MKGKTHTTPAITVRNLQRAISVDIAALERLAQRTAELCLKLPRREATDLKKLREVSVLIVSDRRMASLNQQFLNEAGPTDVLTFQHGEIFISAETAWRHSQRFGNTVARELCLYIVHGLLHLHGFDDENEAAARTMEKTQRQILEDAER
jgi:probable rRNA maturation factor